MSLRISTALIGLCCAAALSAAPCRALALGIGEIQGEVTDRFGLVFDSFSESSAGESTFDAQQTAETEEPRDAAATASIAYEETFDGDILTSVTASGEAQSSIGVFSNLRAVSTTRYSLTFILEAQATFTFFSSLAASQQNQTGTAASVRVTLSPGIIEARLDTRGGTTDPFGAQGLLPPGSYTLEAFAETGIGTPPSNAAAASSFQLTLILGPAPCDNVFTEQSDDIVGTAGDDHLCGGAGADTIDGAGGNDLIFGGDGNDTIVAGEGDDTVFGEKNQDDIEGGAGADLIFGGDQDDTIDGGNGDDALYGGLDDDTLDGAGGSDSIDGERGNDVITGGAGDDSLLSGGAGDDDIFGCGGSDDLEGGPASDELFGDIDDPDGGCASGALEPDAGSTLPARDILIGNVGRDFLFGNDGNDRLRGGYGDDDLQGENGNDTMLGGPRNDVFIGGPGRDRMRGGRGNDGFVANDATEDLVDGGEDCDAAGGFFDDGLDVLESIEEPDGVCTLP